MLKLPLSKSFRVMAPINDNFLNYYYPWAKITIVSLNEVIWAKNKKIKQ